MLLLRKSDIESALPMQEAVSNTRYINVYFDMISALTTTGAPVFEPDRLATSLHLWRALVGWLGGLLIWVTAVAVLATAWHSISRI